MSQWPFLYKNGKFLCGSGQIFRKFLRQYTSVHFVIRVWRPSVVRLGWLIFTSLYADSSIQKRGRAVVLLQTSLFIQPLRGEKCNGVTCGDSNSSTDVHTCPYELLFHKITEAITFQITEISSWITLYMRTEYFRIITQRLVVIYNRRFGSTYLPIFWF